MKQPTNPDRMLTTEEVSARLGVNPKTIRQWLREGKLKGVKTGPRLWRIRERDLERFIVDGINHERRIRLLFRKCIQDSQEFGSNDEHMMSRVFFLIEVDGAVQGEFFATIQQTVGTSYAEGPINQVEAPRSIEEGRKYTGPLDYGEYRAEVESYFRKCVAQGIRFSGGGKNTRMFHNGFHLTDTAEFTAEESSKAW